ncbi:hypothetical protein CFP56_029337 [Quercus suber]|uniref:Uncharacterized protein n=1 Tax=Quercus suber TaxID=58331 RepID=A0AAW0LUW3_QUESU
MRWDEPHICVASLTIQNSKTPDMISRKQHYLIVLAEHVQALDGVLHSERIASTLLPQIDNISGLTKLPYLPSKPNRGGCKRITEESYASSLRICFNVLWSIGEDSFASSMGMMLNIPELLRKSLLLPPWG